jgi:hypothetical protein
MYLYLALLDKFSCLIVTHSVTPRRENSLDSQRDASEGEEFGQTVLNTSGGETEHNDPTE